jgi:tellurite resistance-related uncharacterized protein
MSTPRYPIYNLANPHFNNVEIVTDKNKIINGQFVQFKVLKGDVEYIYPADKYCFLPVEKQEEFWNQVKINNGEFKEFPKYILKFGLDDMKKISITPILVP